MRSICPSVGRQYKASPYVSEFRMDHARIFKGTRGSVVAPHPFEIPLPAFLSGEFLAPAVRRMLRSPEWCPTASDVLMDLFSHSSFAVVLCKPSMIYHFNTFCHYFDFPVIPANAGISFCLIKFLHFAPLSKHIICSVSCDLFWV